MTKEKGEKDKQLSTNHHTENYIEPQEHLQKNWGASEGHAVPAPILATISL